MAVVTNNGILGTNLTAPHLRAGGKVFIGWVNDSGQHWVTQFDEATLATVSTLVGTISGADRHMNPALAALADGRLAVTYGNHGNGPTFFRVSTNPGDSTAWGPVRTVTANQFLYPHLCVTDEGAGTDRVYVFGTRTLGGGREAVFAYTDNEGASFSTVAVLLQGAAGEDVYMTARKSAATGRILCGFTNSNPDQSSALASGYVLAYDPSTGDWEAPNGTTLSLPVTSFPGSSQCFAAASNGNEEVDWVVTAYEGGGEISAVFMARTRPGMLGNYYRATWDGDAWALSAVFDDNEQVIRGCYALDGFPDDIFGLQQVDEIWDVFRYTETSPGVWTSTNLTNGEYMPASAGQVLPYVVEIKGGTPDTTPWVLGHWELVKTNDFQGIIYVEPRAADAPEPAPVDPSQMVFRDPPTGALMVTRYGALVRAYPGGQVTASIDVSGLPAGVYVVFVDSYRDGAVRRGRVDIEVLNE
jgi:hypothetical protein